MPQHLLLRFAADRSGASAVEYALVASLIAVAIIAVVATIGLNLSEKANAIAEAIADAGR